MDHALQLLNLLLLPLMWKVWNMDRELGTLTARLAVLEQPQARRGAH